jgi:hypothetical protein
MKTVMGARTVPAMSARVLALLRARIRAQREGSSFPVGALMMQGVVTVLLCGLVADQLPPFAYGVFALSVCAALVAIPLLGELSSLLTADEADEWVRALPATGTELRLARLLHLLIALATLTLGSVVPAAVVAEVAPVQRVLLVALGLGQSLFLAAVLLLVQATFRGRAQSLLVIAQTALFLVVLVGAVVGLRYVPLLADLAAPNAQLVALPPAWFAAPLAGQATFGWSFAGPLVIAASALVLVVLPAPPREAARRGQPLLSRLLTPFRAAAARLWVRADERAAFDLVYDALPKEREVVLRSYPLIAVPLAFLLLGAQGEADDVRNGLLALLLFTPGAYLPILLMHVPASHSHDARWILDTAPVSEVALAGGALKAVAVRFVVPLYVVLGLLAASYGGVGLALRLVPLALVTALLVLRSAWGLCVTAPPLSIAPDAIKVELNLGGVLGTYAFTLMVVSIVAHLFVTTVVAALVGLALLIGLEAVTARSWRSKGVWTG